MRPRIDFERKRLEIVSRLHLSIFAAWPVPISSASATAIALIVMLPSAFVVCVAVIAGVFFVVAMLDDSMRVSAPWKRPCIIPETIVQNPCERTN